MRRVALLLLLAACSGAADTDTSGDTSGDTSADPRFDRSTWPTTLGGARPAAVTAPTTWDGERELALIVVLHGYGATGAVQDSYFGVSARADRGFVAVIPDGTVDGSGRRFWNATDACCDFAGTGVDDVAYLLGLIDEAIASFPIDPDRVAVIGHSNGGFMAHRLACDAPARLDAIVSLAGASYGSTEDCRGLSDAEARVPRVLQAHGTLDTTIAYDGGLLGGGAAYPGAVESAARWAARASCGERRQTGQVNHDTVVVGDETSIEVWEGCADGRAAGLWTMERSGHIPLINNDFRDAAIAWMLGE